MKNQPSLLNSGFVSTKGACNEIAVDYLQLFVDNAKEFILFFDPALNIALYNQPAADYIRTWVGVDVSKGMHLSEILPSGMRQKIIPVYQSVLAGAETTFEEEVKKEDSYLIFASSLKPAFNNSGDIVGLISITNDVTVQRKKEGAIKLFEERWQFALDKSNHGLWEWDMLTDNVTYSDAHEKLFGFNQNEPTSSSNEWLSRVHPEDLPIVKDALQRHTYSDDPFFESIYRLKDVNEKYRWILARGMIISRNKEGEPINMIGSHTDITPQKEAEEQYKKLFFNHPIPMWIYKPSTLRILEVNEAATFLYGYTRAEFLNFTIHDLLPEEQRNSLYSLLDNIKPDVIHKHRALHVKKNGEKFWADFTGNDTKYNNQTGRLVSVVDVTEGVLFEEALRKSNERLQLAAQAASQALWEWDILNDEVYISPVYKNMFGFDIDPERKYEEWHNYIHPEDQKTTISGFYAAIENPQADNWAQEYRYLTSDGTYMHVEDRCLIKRDACGKAVKAIGAIQNVNNRKKSEEQILEMNERFRLATKATRDVIYDWNLKTNEINWSDALQKLFGYRSSDVTIEKWESLLHLDDKERVMNSLNFAIHKSQNKIWKELYRFKKNDGSYSYVLERAFIVRNEEGKAIRLIGALQDITDLKLTEQELIKSNDRYKYASLATSEIIWDWNLEKGTILWSENYQRIFGWDLPENKSLPYTSCQQKIHPQEKERVWNSMQSAIKNTHNILWQEEFRYLKNDNTYAYVSDKGYVIRNEAGKAIRMIGAMEDISEKKYADALLTLERRVFELNASNNTSFEEVVDALLHGIENLHPQMFTSVLLLNTNQTIKVIGGPRLPAAYKNAINGLQIGPYEGSCGASMFLKKTVIVSQIDTDPLWKKYKNLAAAFDLRACYALPVLNKNGDVMGSIAIYHKEYYTPAQEEVETIERMRDLLRILMENHLSLEKIKAANHRFDSVMQATHDLIWDWDLETGTFYRDTEGMKKVYGVIDDRTISNIHAWMQRVHPEEHDTVQQVINDILHSSDERFFDLEYRFRRDDGEYNFIYDRGYIVRNNEGKPVRMVGAAQNISERKKLEKQLLQRELDKQKLISQATIEIQEKERGEIGKELHDNVNQVLTTTKLYLDLTHSNPEMKDDLIQKSSKNIIYVIDEIRQLSRSLMNPSLGDLGLIDSLNDLVDNINFTRKLKVAFETELSEDTIPENIKVTVFRIVQEVLNNAIKHAKATFLKIDVSASDKELLVTIIDDGIGFDPKAVRRGAGLNNIQNRVYLADGTLTITSKPHKGCTISIKFPLNNNKS